jgi:gluconolactonase
VYRYPLLGPGQLGTRTLFAPYRRDGMTVDETGNLYLCTGNYGQGVVVIHPQGETLGAIELPENAHNVCFAGPDFRTLYIAATHDFYALDMNVRGASNGSSQP